MFKCSYGHTTFPNENQFRVTTKVREVRTVHTIIGEKNKKTQIVGLGRETVEEEIFCEKHVIQIEPQIIESVDRYQVRNIPNYKEKEQWQEPQY